MIDTLRARFTQTALGPAVVIWAFGYLLVDIVAYLLGRSAPGLNLIFSAPMFVLGISQTLALNFLRRRTHGMLPALRWPLLILAILAATAIQALFDLYWLRWVSLSVIPQWQAWALFINLQRLFTVGILYLWTFCLALTSLWAARVSGTVEASRARAASAEAAAARSEAAALRLQLNPHFMFNTLNSISSLVLLDRKHDAEEMISRLCDFLRSSLYSDPMADVPLTQEIDCIDAYLGIEAARFGDGLEIRIEVDPAAGDARVPNFILQPLVENAIKHGIAAVSGPSLLAVTARREAETLVLSVVNSAEGAPILQVEARPSTGIGLANIRQRLANRYGDGASLETTPTVDGYRAVIRLPFVEAAPEADQEAA